MLLNIPIVKNNKTLDILFQITKENKQYIVKPYNNNTIYYDVIINNYNHGIYTYPIAFPLIFNINKNNLICELFMLIKSYKMYENDFFYLILNKINSQSKYKYKYYNNIDIEYIENLYSKQYDYKKKFNTVNDLMLYIYYRTNYFINIYLYYLTQNNKYSSYVSTIKTTKLIYNGNNKYIHEYLKDKKIINDIYFMYIIKKNIEPILTKLYKKNQYYVKLYKYFMGNYDNIIYINFVDINEIGNDFRKYKSDLIITNNELSFDFFKDIINNDNIFNINVLVELFNQYNYPLNFSKNDINLVLKKIIYYTLKFKKNINEIYNKFINIKCFTFLIKFFNLVESDTDLLYDSYIQYYDILNILITSNFLNITSILNNDIITNFYMNKMYINILNNINWGNIKYKLDHMNFLFINYNEDFNNLCNNDRIKKILLKPNSFYKYLKKENDFIKWLYVVDFKINDMFYNPIKIKHNDYFKLGKILYLFSKTDSYDMNDYNYKTFINFISKNSYLVLLNNKINIKFKDIFKDKHINLGFIAKHLNLNIDSSIIFVQNDIVMYETINDKMNKYMKKYEKYKLKYNTIKQIQLEYKN